MTYCLQRNQVCFLIAAYHGLNLIEIALCKYSAALFVVSLWSFTMIYAIRINNYTLSPCVSETNHIELKTNAKTTLLYRSFIMEIYGKLNYDSSKLSHINMNVYTNAWSVIGLSVYTVAPMNRLCCTRHSPPHSLNTVHKENLGHFLYF